MFYDYYIHVEGVLSVKLCFVTLLSSETYPRFWKISPATRSHGEPNIQFQNKMPRRAELTANTLCCLTVPHILYSRRPVTNYCSDHSGRGASISL